MDHTESIVTVTQPASTIDLTVLDTVKDELDIDDNDSDDRLARWITDESDRIATFLGRPVAQASYEEVFRVARFERFLKLSRYPVATLTQVTDVDGTVLVLGTDFDADLKTGILYRLSSDTRTHWARGKVIVDYTAGWALLEDLPRQIEEACLTLVKHRWHARTRDPMVTSEEIAGVERTTFWVGGTNVDSGMPPEVEALLRPFREVRT